MTRLRLCAVLGFFSVFGAIVPAEADGFWAGDWPYGSGWRQAGYVLESPPYFAMHPPVYYGLPISRPYGLSPYPWPPAWEFRQEERFSAPRPIPVEPMRIRNPFVEPSSPAEPIRIRNPFVEQPEKGASPTPSPQTPSGPQIIHPAATGGGAS